MEKLIISKKLAKDVYEWQTSVKAGIDKIALAHSIELSDLMVEHNFKTLFQVTAYLLGGQNKVYEIKKDPYMVVWNTENKEFYPLPYNYPLEEGVEIVINTYDIMEDAEYTTQELNNSL